MSSSTHEKAVQIADQLRNAGHEVWFAGGCVRDRLLGREPKDWDIATSARPDEVQALFRRTIGVGKQFGVIVVLADDDAYEVATFRADGAYGDGRRPDEVRFTSAVEDVRRRDFTINGLLMDPSTGRVEDHVGGLADLEARRIRCIGDARERFHEDRLRILRAVRFAARLGFELETETRAAIIALANEAADPSPERIAGELERMLTEAAPGRAFWMLRDLELLPVVLPEVAARRQRGSEGRLALRGYDVASSLDRAQALLDIAPIESPEVTWAVLADDLDSGFARARSRAAEVLMRRLRVSKRLAEDVAELVLVRDRLLFAPSPSAARRALCAAHANPSRLATFRDLHLKVLSAEGDAREPLLPRALPPPLLRGPDLIAVGVPKGPPLGRWLRRLRFRQLNGNLSTADEARSWLAIALRRGGEGRSS
ncbi:MAG: CCA tRNA nucleotidyltransferase [Planctomycetes bacterium]|nr:CCA tRNA nucleotidyltransferase [Planctomycetota bacterium]